MELKMVEDRTAAIPTFYIISSPLGEEETRRARRALHLRVRGEPISMDNLPEFFLIEGILHPSIQSHAFFTREEAQSKLAEVADALRRKQLQVVEVE